MLSLLTVERALFALLVALLAARVLLGKVALLPLLAVEKWMAVVLGVVVLSLLSTAGDKSSAELYRSAVLLIQGFVMPFAAFVLARTTPWRPEHFVRLFRLLSIAGVYLAAAGAVQYFLQTTILMPSYVTLAKMDRASGTFVSFVEYGAVMLVLCVVTLFQYARTTDAVARAFMLAVTVLMLGAVALSKTRAVWVAGVLAFALLYRNDRRVRPVLVGGGVVAVMFVIYAELSAGRVDDVTSVFNRIALYATAANVFVHNPFVGVGFGADSFVQNRAAYFASFGPVTAQWAADVGPPHNELLNILLMTGLAGGIPYVLLWVAALKLTRRFEASVSGAASFGEELAVYVRAAAVIVLVNALFADVIFFTYLLTLFFFLLGVLVVCRQHRDIVEPVTAGRS
jgi:O-antigen ligase